MGTTAAYKINQTQVISGFKQIPVMVGGTATSHSLGYNYYKLPALKAIPKGSLIYLITMSGGKMAINTQSPGLYNDFEENKLLNTKLKMAVMFNVITQTTALNAFNKIFLTTGMHVITSSFSCDGSTYSETQVFAVVNGLCTFSNPSGN